MTPDIETQVNVIYEAMHVYERAQDDPQKLSALDELPTLRDLKELAPDGARTGDDAPAEQLADAAAAAGAGEAAPAVDESGSAEATVEAPATDVAGEAPATDVAGEAPATETESAGPAAAQDPGTSREEAKANTPAPAEPVANDPPRPFAAVARAE